MESIDSVNLSAPRPRPPSVRVRLNQPSYTAGEAVILTVHIENRSANQAGRQRDYSQQQQQQYQRGDYGADGTVQVESLSVEVKGVIRSASAPRADTTWSCAAARSALPAHLSLFSPPRTAPHSRPARFVLDSGTPGLSVPRYLLFSPSSSPSLLTSLFLPLFTSSPSLVLTFPLPTSTFFRNPLVLSPTRADTIEIPLPINALPSGRMAGNDSLALPLSLPLDDASDPPAPDSASAAAVLYLVSVSADWRGISVPCSPSVTSAAAAAAARPVVCSQSSSSFSFPLSNCRFSVFLLVAHSFSCFFLLLSSLYAQELLAWFKVKADPGTSHGPAPPNATFNPACPPCARLSAHESTSGGPPAALALPLSTATALASPSCRIIAAFCLLGSHAPSPHLLSAPPFSSPSPMFPLFIFVFLLKSSVPLPFRSAPLPLPSQSPFRPPQLTTPIASAFLRGSSLPPTPTPATPTPPANPPQSRRLLPHLSVSRESTAPSRAPPCPDDVEAVSVAAVLPCDVSSNGRFGAWGWAAQGQGSNLYGGSSDAEESCFGDKQMHGPAAAAAAANAVHGLAHVPEGSIVAHSSGSGSSNSSVWGGSSSGSRGSSGSGSSSIRRRSDEGSSISASAAAAVAAVRAGGKKAERGGAEWGGGWMGGRGMVRSSTTGQVAEWGGGAGGSELVGIAEVVAGVAAAGAAGSAVAGAGARGMRRSCSDDDGMRGHGRGSKAGPMWGSGGSAEEAEEGEAEGENTYSSSSSSSNDGSSGWGSEDGVEKTLVGRDGGIMGGHGGTDRSDERHGNSLRTMSLPAARRLPAVPVEGLLAPEHDQEFPRELLLPQHTTMLPPHAPNNANSGNHANFGTHANFGNHANHPHHARYPVCRGPDCQHTSRSLSAPSLPHHAEVEAFCRNMDSARVRIESIDIQHESRNKTATPHGMRGAAQAGFRTKAMHGGDGDGEGGVAEEGQGEQEQENGKRREREEVGGMEACSRVLFAVKFQGMSLWHYPATDSVKPLFRMAS
ncbi:unnamed protein product [Closterium sp. Naga37s-1]|nr:unnamed protein product [Closterium sp. Naga37s-1]